MMLAMRVNYWLREDHKERQHQGEQPKSLGQREAKNGVVEQLLREVRLAGACNEQVAEDRPDPEANAAEGDGSKSGADVVQPLNADGHRGRLAQRDGTGRGRKQKARRGPQLQRPCSTTTKHTSQNSNQEHICGAAGEIFEKVFLPKSCYHY